MTNIKYIKQLLGGFGFTFSKQLGQNFLINPSVCPQMAELCGCDGIGVLEIGPGIGVLTRELAEIAKKVVAIELDTRLKPVLDITLAQCDNVSVVYGDCMKLNLKQLIAEQFGDMPVVICANLPYYITSPVIMMLLESRLAVNGITVMVQKEAAARLCARLGTRESGAVTAAVSYYASAIKLFDVERGSFMPAPNVDSAVIQLTPHAVPPVSVKDERTLFRVIRAAFGQRRKTLANSLSSGLSLPKNAVSELLSRCEIKQTARAEELVLSQFAALADAIFSEEKHNG